MGNTELEYEVAEGVMVFGSDAYVVQDADSDDVNLYVSIYTDCAEEKFKEIAIKAVESWKDMALDEREPVVKYLYKALRENGIDADIYERVDCIIE